MDQRRPVGAAAQRRRVRSDGVRRVQRPQSFRRSVAVFLPELPAIARLRRRHLPRFEQHRLAAVRLRSLAARPRLRHREHVLLPVWPPRETRSGLIYLVNYFKC